MSHKQTAQEKVEFGGTPHYISPEMYAQVEVDEKTDVWSMGVFTYYVTNLKLPFTSEFLK